LYSNIEEGDCDVIKIKFRCSLKEKSSFELEDLAKKTRDFEKQLVKLKKLENLRVKLVRIKDDL